MTEQIVAKEEKSKFSEEKVELWVKGQKLVGNIFVPEGVGPFPGVVFYHGRNSSKQNYLPIGQELAENGIVAFCFDFRGHGESEGDPLALTIKDLWLDTTKAFDFLRKKSGFEDENTSIYGLCGTSMGGDFAATLAGIWSQNVKSLILRSPTAYSNEARLQVLQAAHPSRILKTRGDWKDAKVFRVFKGFRGHFLIVASQNDELIPQALIQDYLDHAFSVTEKSLYVIKDAGHYLGVLDSPFRQEFKKVVVDWFKKTLLA